MLKCKMIIIQMKFSPSIKLRLAVLIVLQQHKLGRGRHYSRRCADTVDLLRLVGLMSSSNTS